MRNKMKITNRNNNLWIFLPEESLLLKLYLTKKKNLFEILNNQRHSIASQLFRHQQIQQNGRK